MRHSSRQRARGAVMSTVMAGALVAFPGLADDEGAKGAAPEGASAEAPAATGGDLDIPFEKITLDNGLEVLLHEDHTTPFVAVSVWYHVGAIDEPKGRTGFAHLFEHLMFQGTPNVGDDKHIAYLEQAGAAVRQGMVNGTTNEDRTNYFEVVPSNELELALWLEADRMGYLMDGMTQAKLDEQRDVVKNERLQSIENRAYGLAEEKLWPISTRLRSTTSPASTTPITPPPMPPSPSPATWIRRPPRSW
jgi:zinc protease